MQRLGVLGFCIVLTVLLLAVGFQVMQSASFLDFVMSGCQINFTVSPFFFSFCYKVAIIFEEPFSF